MTKKPRKPRASKQAATPQKSSGAVTSDETTSSATTELANPPEIASRPEEPAKLVQDTASASPVTMATVHQSMIPPTDDIDLGWGGEDDGQQNSFDSTTFQLAKTESEEPVTGLRMRAESADSTKIETTSNAPMPNEVSEGHAVPTHESASSASASLKSQASAPLAAAPSSRPSSAVATPAAPSVAPSRVSAAPAEPASVPAPQKSPVAADEVTSVVDAELCSTESRRVAPARSSTPASGTTSVQLSVSPSTAVPASAPPTSRATPSQGMASPPPPPSARGNPVRETTSAAIDAASRSASRRPSPGLGVSSTPPPPSARAIAPRDTTDAASRVAARPSRSPATLRPSAIASLAAQARASKVPSSQPLNATSSPASETPARRAPPSLRPSTAPRASAAVGAAADQRNPTSSATPVPSSAQATEIQPDATAQSLTQPSPEVRAVASVLSLPEVPAVASVPLTTEASRVEVVAAATFPTDSEALPSFGPDRIQRKRVALVALWLATAVVPATIVWFAKPPPSVVDCNCSNAGERRAPVAKPPPQVQKPAEPAAPAMPPSDLQKESVGPPSAAAAAAAIESTSSALTPATPTVAPATSVASTVPVVVETESNDRISVLVKSRPTGAKVLRRGKEIGRTPLTIQIGRGEHRIFEVGSLAFGTRRISLDGEKTEVMVNIGAPPKPDK
jgi:hypothetical protein